MRGPEATIRTTGAAVCIRPDESTRAESTQANSNSAAENAAMGPHCSVFFPGWRKTRLWGLSKHIEVAEKARKGAAKRQKRQKSPQWGPECHTGPMQRGPLSAFSAILRAKPCNRRFPAKKKPAKRYEHLAGIRHDALRPLSARCFCPKGIASAINRRLRIHPRTPPQNTASTWHYGFFIKPQGPC